MTCNKLFCFFVLDKLRVILEWNSFLYLNYCDGLQSAFVNKLSPKCPHSPTPLFFAVPLVDRKINYSQSFDQETCTQALSPFIIYTYIYCFSVF